MKQVSSLLAWGAVAIVAALAALNWSTLMAQAPLDLVVAQIQAPLGAVLLGVAGVLVTLFFVAYLHTQINSLLETRRLLKEVQRVQGLADKAEASRIEALHQLITNEFRLVNDRLSVIVSAPARAAASSESGPTPVTESGPDHKQHA